MTDAPKYVFREAWSYAGKLYPTRAAADAAAAAAGDTWPHVGICYVWDPINASERISH